jgi:hypothetical protein
MSLLPSLMCHRGSPHIRLDLHDELKGDDDYNDKVVNSENNVAKHELQSDDVVYVESVTITKHVKQNKKTEQDIKGLLQSDTMYVAQPIGACIDPDIFSFPTLHETQEKACISFLATKSMSITLVQDSLPWNRFVLK